MSVIQSYFDQVEAAEAKKSTNGTVLGKFFTPPTETPTINLEVKQIADEMGAAIVEIFKSFERQNNVRFNFTRKAGRPR